MNLIKVSIDKYNYLKNEEVIIFYTININLNS